MISKLKKSPCRFAAIIVISLIAVSPALAVEYVDIEQTVVNYVLANYYDWHQTFIPNAYNISAVSVNLYSVSGTVTIRVLDSVCGTVLAHGSGTGGPGWVKCDLVGVQALVPGQSYAIYAYSSAKMRAGSGNPYSDGVVWLSCTSTIANYDLAFRTWTDDQAVPNTETTWGSVKSLYR